MNLPIHRISILLFGTLFVLASCGDDEEDPSRRDLLIGTWEILSGDLVDYQVTIEGATLDRSAVQGLAVLNPDVAAVDQAIEEGTDILFPEGTLISFNDDNSFTLDDQSGAIEEGTWSLSDDEETITIRAANDLGVSELDFAITSLTEQTVNVALQVDESDVNLENFDLDNLPISIEGFAIDYDFSFRKQ